MLYVLFAVVMILNLLVAMFATTYSRVRGDSSTIWKKQRYNLVIEYYNNPAKVDSLAMGRIYFVTLNLANNAAAHPLFGHLLGNQVRGLTANSKKELPGTPGSEPPACSRTTLS
jgi:hypothetical protein